METSDIASKNHVQIGGGKWLIPQPKTFGGGGERIQQIYARLKKSVENKGCYVKI